MQFTSDQVEKITDMNDAIDRIGEAMIDALGAWNQLLQDAKPRFDHRYTINHFGIPSTAMVMKTCSSRVQQRI